jgi:hypothetical protein
MEYFSRGIHLTGTPQLLIFIQEWERKREPNKIILRLLDDSTDVKKLLLERSKFRELLVINLLDGYRKGV